MNFIGLETNHKIIKLFSRPFRSNELVFDENKKNCDFKLVIIIMHNFVMVLYAVSDIHFRDFWFAVWCAVLPHNMLKFSSGTEF